ncbi:hypothetical protein LTR37_017641 [Vermiconidia calcicola]|uniref:Uncharacterized protein n=1 Tax=Vermiconidia calcicola TaxID=1690605 RepID=A0ACC3MJS5_9PEZI|nr:hypothetical protein LTR37_017641 [Vermiconidia calcicola]
MADFQLLQRLPEELLQDILERLSKHDLSLLNPASRWCYRVATPLIWREVQLVDCRTLHEDETDDHDDTPFLKKLLVLIRKPWIASCVQALEHRCHLPPPAIFHELPRTPLSGQTLSVDPRTTKLVQLAVQHMHKVHTLRIIFGHPNVNDALLRCFFDKDRKHTTPVRRLWLENCRFSAGCDPRIESHPLGLPLELDFAGLKSIRFRRMPIQTGHPLYRRWGGEFNHSRGSKKACSLQDGAGGSYTTLVDYMNPALDAAGIPQFSNDGTDEWDERGSIEHLLEPALRFDGLIFEHLGCSTELPPQLHDLQMKSRRELSRKAYRGPYLDPINLIDRGYGSAVEGIGWLNRERIPSSDVALTLLGHASDTLTSVCLDWILADPDRETSTPRAYIDWVEMFNSFFGLRFPHLKALQFRNAVVRETLQPSGLFLLDEAQIWCERGDGREPWRAPQLTCLKFMEAHSKLRCLAWPMDAFFSEKPLPADINSRVGAVIDNLGRTLEDLRVDTLYGAAGEPHSEDFGCQDPGARERRRRFISDFAAKMTKVESIKIEGGVPRDERREVIRALHACPLKKLVMIGVCSPLGNTWGAQGRDLGESFLEGESDYLEAEDKDAVYSFGSREPARPPPDFVFQPTYGWPAGPPMIHTIASLHADTITELKFCGYKGSPKLFSPTPITTPMLSALKYFHSLETLIMSMWLSTIFEEAPRDADIIKYWLDARSPQSMSLVRTVIDEEPEGWEKELRTKFAPDALAWQITSLVGPFLSEKAKARKGGVHVRASVCIGEWGGIFDIDLHIGKGSMNSDVCLSYKGPREELEPERRRTKLESRRWF